MASSTYYAAVKRPPSARAVRDAVMMPILLALWTANYKVYGVRKLHKAAVRAGHAIGRDQTGRLMAQLGIQGRRRGKRVQTTRPDPAASRPPDLVDRNFTATGPNQLWVVDLTYVPTWQGHRLRRVSHRRLQSPHRRLARRISHAYRHGLSACEHNYIRVI